MQVSAEIRWFWEASAPDLLRVWFCGTEDHVIAAGGGQLRTDRYLYEKGQRELGVKTRGDNSHGTEVKGLVVESSSHVATEPFIGPIQIWTKWTLRGLELDSKRVIVTEKRRWLRKFDTTSGAPVEIELDERETPKKGALPATGCNVELTEIRLPQTDEVWWTLGFESFGSIRKVEEDLVKVTTELAARKPPKLSGGLVASYPAWLNR